MMSIREHMDELRARMLSIIISVMILTIFSMVFGIKSFILHYASINNNNGIQLFYPYPDLFSNIAIQLTSYMEKTLLPAGVNLIQTAPGQAFFAQI